MARWITFHDGKIRQLQLPVKRLWTAVVEQDFTEIGYLIDEGLERHGRRSLEDRKLVVVAAKMRMDAINNLDSTCDYTLTVKVEKQNS